MKGAYYNEHDPDKAAWLRELIKRGVIADGEVDQRDIQQVEANELRGFAQCHFFAGIGVWSYALRSAGWADDRPVWTGSCPCQPFSSAGARKALADPRHLWPHWFRLIAECRPHHIFGEQVASKDGLAWLDLVYDDLENAAYTVGAVDLCAAGVGAPHIRQRLWIMAHPLSLPGRLPGEGWSGDPQAGGRREIGPLADSHGHGNRQHARELQGDEGQYEKRPSSGDHPPIDCGPAGLMANTAGERYDGRGPGQALPYEGPEQESKRLCDASELADALFTRRAKGRARSGNRSAARSSSVGPVNGFWGDAEWIPCTDGKARAVRPGTFPLAHGAPARVVRLRGYGDGIVAEAAKEVILTYREMVEHGN